MISVCVPVYNTDVRDLAELLAKQADRLAVPVELIFIDDASDIHFRETNRQVQHYGRYIELDVNIGRAQIRNIFLKYAVFDFLLFLDCDAQIISNSFLENYLAAIPSGATEIVICGGKVYPDQKPESNRRLRWKYGIQKESTSARERSRFPNRSFMSNNFLISRKLLIKFPFDKRLAGYGHEDTLLGFVLKKNDVEILHIENPVMNGELETNKAYLSKVDQSIVNLRKTLDITDYDKDFINDNALPRVYYRYIKIGPFLTVILSTVYPVIKFLLERAFLSSIRLLDLYKYYLFLKEMQSGNKTSNK